MKNNDLNSIKRPLYLIGSVVLPVFWMSRYDIYGLGLLLNTALPVLYSIYCAIVWVTSNHRKPHIKLGLYVAVVVFFVHSFASIKDLFESGWKIFPGFALMIIFVIFTISVLSCILRDRKKFKVNTGRFPWKSDVFLGILFFLSLISLNTLYSYYDLKSLMYSTALLSVHFLPIVILATYTYMALIYTVKEKIWVQLLKAILVVVVLSLIVYGISLVLFMFTMQGLGD